MPENLIEWVKKNNIKHKESYSQDGSLNGVIVKCRFSREILVEKEMFDCEWRFICECDDLRDEDDEDWGECECECTNQGYTSAHLKFCIHRDSLPISPKE